MFWYNGNLIQSNSLELEIDNPALLYGATVFTTLRVYHQSLDHPLTNWVGHCDRLRSSLQTFDWQQPNWKRLRLGVEELMTTFPVLRMAVFPDGSEFITGRYLPNDLTQRQQQGIVAWLATAKFYRTLPEHKTGNYLPAWLALNKAKTFGAQEAVLVDASGNWLETSTGNLWGWREGKWWTPPVEAGILPGIARSQLLDWLYRQNQQVVEVSWSAEWVQSLEAIAYTNSVVQVVPIHTVITHNHSLAYSAAHPSLEQLKQFFAS